MIESFNDFLKRTDYSPVFESNEAAEMMVIPEESLKTGGSADRQMWEKERNFTFNEPEFVFENPYLKKISSIVLKHLRTNLPNNWSLYPFVIETEGKKSVLINSKTVHLVLYREGIVKRIIVYSSNPLNEEIDAIMSVSTQKRGFLSAVRTLVAFLMGASGPIFEAKVEPNITIDSSMKTRTGISKAVDKIMGPKKGKVRDADLAMNFDDLNEFLKLYETLDDGEIAKKMTSDWFKEGDPLREVQSKFFVNSMGELDKLNALSGSVYFFHMALTGVTNGLSDKQIEDMQELWFWQGGKSGKLATDVDSGGRWYVKDSKDVMNDEIDDLEANMALEKKIMVRMLRYVQYGGKEGTAKNLMGLIARHRGLLITGCAGIGKSVGVRQAIEETDAKEGTDYIQIKAVATTQALYKQLYRFDGMVMIFDDVDTLLDEPEKVMLFKQALQEDESERTIQTTAARAAEAMAGNDDDNEYYNALNTTRRERYFKEVGSVSNYEKKQKTEEFFNKLKQREEREKKADKLYRATPDSVLRIKAEQKFNEWAENERNSKYPTSFTYNGFIVNITNKPLNEFANDRKLKAHWGAISSRMSVIDISPRSRVIWAWLKRKIYQSLDDPTIPEEDKILPRVGGAQNATIENVISFIDSVMVGEQNRAGKIYGKISFRAIANIRFYLNSEENTEKFWKEQILHEMLIDSERTQY